MKNLFLLFILLAFSQKNVFSQKKDTLFFKLNPKCIDVKKNYEGVHSFIIKDEEFVTSAFNEIVKEDLFFFTQADFPPKTYKLKPIKIYKLKKFIKENRHMLKEKSTNKLDAYKIMEFFDKYVVFFKKEKNTFIKVRVHTTLSE
ncbi:hypothetical protein LPB136_11045 [Tenacibaculum todarodis]|uniref:Uncharacterized protein n=1 Tax=Tenacibaculum todarodis TaxID=1850252 RepID=A0A1L3JL66_9FLAO|nr:hypothetical protein [Tenacibaculum todarodis]APG65868.1 hypothetical protein LPB136_11045 [Tenacibaculum todarodis]